MNMSNNIKLKSLHGYLSVYILGMASKRCISRTLMTKIAWQMMILTKVSIPSFLSIFSIHVLDTSNGHRTSYVYHVVFYARVSISFLLYLHYMNLFVIGVIFVQLPLQIYIHQYIIVKGKSQNQEIDIFGNKEEEKKYPLMSKILDNWVFQLVISFFTLYALFGDDLRILAFSKSSDIVFNILSIIAMVGFFIEIILSVCVKSDYLNSFFFWLDLISTVTLVLDLTWVNESISDATSGGAGGIGKSSSIARASRAGRIGTKYAIIIIIYLLLLLFTYYYYNRAGRIVRIIRLIRLVKIFKIVQNKRKNMLMKQKMDYFEKSDDKDNYVQDYNIDSGNDQYNYSNPDSAGKSGSKTQKMTLQQKLEKKQSDKKMQQEDENQDDEFKDEKESRVGKKLAEIITIRVIILVLVLILFLPLFSADYYFDQEISLKTQLYQLKGICTSTDETNVNTAANQEEVFNQIWTFNVDSSITETPIIYLDLQSPKKPKNKVQSPSLDDLRFNEKQSEVVEYTWNGQTYLIKGDLDVRQKTKYEALIGICRTIFVAIVLTLGSMYFSKDINDLALRPIERMIRKVNQIAQNPLSSKDQEIVKGADVNTNETLLIENAITKIGVLLALGFGEAGSEIIAKNMAQKGDLDPMLPGKRQCAIFGFCDIRNFTDATEILQEDVMVFVNTIAKVVHSIIDRYAGSANKNIGDAFLLVWKIPDYNVRLQRDGNYIIKKNRQVKNICDLSLISFLKVIAALNRKETILKYRENKSLNDRMPNYRIKMGFGLHVGWAIEGAIGSVFKIDASYLSPNVNMASRLEAATKQYGVPLLLSNELVDCMSKKGQKICRQIDCVTVKGSVKPIGLYTVDMNQANIKPKNRDGNHIRKTQMEKQEKKKMMKDIFSEFTKENTTEKANLLFFEEDEDLPLMLEDSESRFREVFDEGFRFYIDGQWSQAKTFFETCISIKPDEEPSKTLLNVLKSHMYNAPADWKGYRPLTDK